MALENTFKATTDIDVIAGVSYDRNDLRLAQEFNTTAGLFEYPTGSSDAVNLQAQTRWRYAAEAELHASVSSRTRFPTIFERYSTRFGTALPNPDLDPERAVNYELGWQGRVLDNTNLTAALFYNDVKDMIQTVVVSAGPPQLTQTANVGNGEYYGIELGADAQINEHLKVGGNYSLLKRSIDDPLQPNLQATGTPTHQGFLYVSYRPIDAVYMEIGRASCRERV